MNRLTFDAWRRQGSSVLFDAELLSPHLHQGHLVSLRQVLCWAEDTGTLPDAGRTVLVGGLDTVLRVLPPTDAEQFLQRRIQPLIQRFQRQRGDQGLVFGFNAAPQSFRLSPREQVEFRVGSDWLRLSAMLWTPTADIVEVRRDDVDDLPRGYHVRRIS